MEGEDLVEVMDLDFFLGFAGANGQPAVLSYTIREHLGDVVKEVPGVISLHFAPKDVGDNKRIAGERVTISSNHIIGMSRRIRLEPRVRKTAKDYLDPETAQVDRLKEKLGV